ncbi:ATP-binding protein [Microtetraspora fusca]|uniref:ATP-binding protein n=1 Tax=Microtetraspora fusca TaxID=1997 RepID=A0ABW6VFA4_MICFU
MKQSQISRKRDSRNVTLSRTAWHGGVRPLGGAELPGRASSVGEARRWARGLLAGWLSGDAVDDAVVLLSELVTNAVVHSDSGREPDGFVTVFVAAGVGIAHVEVIDDGSATSVPTVREASEASDGGRGLWMVDAMATAWGVHHDDEAGNAVWFEIRDGRPVETPAFSLNHMGGGE